MASIIISNSFEQVCVSQQRSSVSHLAGVSWNTPHQDRHKNDSNDSSMCYLGVKNDKFVVGLPRLVPTDLQRSHLVHVRLVCRWCASVGAICENLHLQGSVATRFGCDGIFNCSFIANCP